MDIARESYLLCSYKFFELKIIFPGLLQSANKTPCEQGIAKFVQTLDEQ